MASNCCLLAHLEEVESFGLQVAEWVFEISHGADCAFDFQIYVFPVRFRCLESRAALEGIQAFVFDQVGTDEILAELWALIIVLWQIDLSIMHFMRI